MPFLCSILVKIRDNVSNLQYSAEIMVAVGFNDRITRFLFLSIFPLPSESLLSVLPIRVVAVSGWGARSAALGGDGGGVDDVAAGGRRLRVRGGEDAWEREGRE